MPKQRHTKSSRPAAKKKPAARVRPKAKPARKPARPAAPARVKRAAAAPNRKPVRQPANRARGPAVRRQASVRPSTVVVATATHEQAVETFERGFKALQQRQFERAAAALKAVIAGFPDEKEMQERARVYLAICERQAGGAGARPKSFEERVNAATVFINRGALDDGLRLLRDLESENAGNDHVQYLLTVAYTSAGDADKALSHLRRAIELNPENRFLSTADIDLEPLRRHASFPAALATPPAPPPPAPARRRAAARKK